MRHRRSGRNVAAGDGDDPVSCGFCNFARQLTANGFVLADHVLNTVLLGDPDETVSARAERARAAGSVAARRFCAVLTWIGNNVFGMNRDHCTWAADPSTHLAGEIWHWSDE
jgi:hypothetical protein